MVLSDLSYLAGPVATSPIEEHIVAKVDHLMTLCDTLKHQIDAITRT